MTGIQPSEENDSAARLRTENPLPQLGAVRVGVIDSGWERKYTDPRVERGVGIVGNGEELDVALSDDDGDRNGHGSVCTSLILRIAPASHVIPIRVFGARLETSPEALIAAVSWALSNGVRLVNLSLSTAREDAKPKLYAACERASRAGVIIVASAANQGQSSLSYPAAFDCVLGVGGGDYPAPFEVRYHPGAVVELSATSRHSVRRRGGKVVEVRGTSFAASVVTGRVAQLLQQNPSLDLDGVRRFFAARSGA
jgi:subtilisin family serine protease